MQNSRQNQKFSTRKTGDSAEILVVRHLESLGYKIVERNFYCKVGELDIIATDTKELVFVEVRSRHSDTALNPLFTLSEKKQNSIKKAAQIYLMKNPVDLPFRFDVAVVTMNPEPEIEIIENAFFKFPFR